MVRIQIKPAHGGASGYLMARGHAGNTLLCNTITAIVECMAVNIYGCWDVRLRRKDESGDYDLRWERECKNSRGIERANRAAGFAYNGLKALADEHPENIKVEWIREEARKC